jgi:hypothetical protein
VADVASGLIGVVNVKYLAQILCIFTHCIRKKWEWIFGE